VKRVSKKKWKVELHTINELQNYRYVIIFARYQNKWLYSRHKDRETFESPGGHIEPGETPLQAAKRELYEETGALVFNIQPAFDYSVHTSVDFANGQVFFAQIEQLGPLPESEICEVRLYDTIPDKMTYPQVLPVLHHKIQGCMEYIKYKK